MVKHRVTILSVSKFFLWFSTCMTRALKALSAQYFLPLSGELGVTFICGIYYTAEGVERPTAKEKGAQCSQGR